MIHERHLRGIVQLSKLYVLNGADAGKSFQLKEGANTIGRSPENNISLQDSNVSRQHLRMVKDGDRYFITDLESKNGTFLLGKYVPPDTETEVKKGVPIAIAMTALGIGEASITLTQPFLASVGLSAETGDESGIFAVHKHKTNQKKLETLYRVSDVFEQKLPVKEALDTVLDIISELLAEIDTASFILIDPSTTKIILLLHRSRNPEKSLTPKFSLPVVCQVIKGKKSVMISNSDKEEVNRELASTLKMNGISSVICVPMVSESQAIGVLYLHSLKKPYGFRPEDATFFEDLAQRMVRFVQYGEFVSELSGVRAEISSGN